MVLLSIFILYIHSTREIETRVSSILSVSIYSHRAIKEVVVGSGSGEGVLFYHLNGTEIGSVETNNQPVYSMVRTMSRLVYGAGTEVGVINVATKRHHAHCPGTTSEIRSVAFDIAAPSMIHAGTMNGEVLVFDTRAGSSGSTPMTKKSGRGKFPCKRKN